MNMDQDKVNAYGLKDPMREGVQHKKESGETFHPLEESEKCFASVRDAAELEQLRQMQGAHAPLRIRMERQAVSKVCVY